MWIVLWDLNLLKNLHFAEFDGPWTVPWDPHFFSKMHKHTLPTLPKCTHSLCFAEICILNIWFIGLVRDCIWHLWTCREIYLRVLCKVQHLIFVFVRLLLHIFLFYKIVSEISLSAMEVSYCWTTQFLVCLCLFLFLLGWFYLFLIFIWRSF